MKMITGAEGKKKPFLPSTAGYLPAHMIGIDYI
jgi:hypothetical protein